MVRSLDPAIHGKEITIGKCGFLVTGAGEEAVSEFSVLAFKNVPVFVQHT